MAVRAIGGLSLFDALSLREPHGKRDRPAERERVCAGSNGFIDERPPMSDSSPASLRRR
jgi:hypothetical protein